MHPDNQFYGHDDVLREYSGLPAGQPLRAHVQHGWSLAHGLAAPRRLVSWLPRLVWSRRNLERAVALGVPRVEAIGAPFLYLVAQEGIDGPEPGSDERNGTIFYPYHSSEWNELEGSNERLVKAILDRSGVDTTVCLYWLDHDNVEMRRQYEEAGFRVITHGRREDPDFLRAQLAELRRHRVVASNRVSTAVWYGGAIGCRMEIFGEVFGARPQGGPEFAAAQQAQFFPALLEDSLSDSEQLDLANAELGLEYRRAPDELRRMLAVPPRAATIERGVARAEHNARAVAHRLLARWVAPRATTGEAIR